VGEGVGRVLKHQVQAADAGVFERYVAHVCVAADKVMRLGVDGDGVADDAAFEYLEQVRLLASGGGWG